MCRVLLYFCTMNFSWNKRKREPCCRNCVSQNVLVILGSQWKRILAMFFRLYSNRMWFDVCGHVSLCHMWNVIYDMCANWKSWLSAQNFWLSFAVLCLMAFYFWILCFPWQTAKHCSRNACTQWKRTELIVWRSNRFVSLKFSFKRLIVAQKRTTLWSFVICRCIKYGNLYD